MLLMLLLLLLMLLDKAHLTQLNCEFSFCAFVFHFLQSIFPRRPDRMFKALSRWPQDVFVACPTTNNQYKRTHTHPHTLLKQLQLLDFFINFPTRVEKSRQHTSPWGVERREQVVVGVARQGQRGLHSVKCPNTTQCKCAKTSIMCHNSHTLPASSQSIHSIHSECASL